MVLEHSVCLPYRTVQYYTDLYTLMVPLSELQLHAGQLFVIANQVCASGSSFSISILES